ncbi:hypothetical protein GA0115241_1070279 [Streptomyces sp. DpondAA-D4]|nr:hypothetical protein GA0115241_1070279 [Streptomyces sp. DpondAA-D4]
MTDGPVSAAGMRGARRSPGFLRIRKCVLLMQRRTRCLYGSGQTESLGMICSAFPLDGPSSLGSTHGPDSPVRPLRPHNGCRRGPPYVSRVRCPSRRWRGHCGRRRLRHRERPDGRTPRPRSARRSIRRSGPAVEGCRARRKKGGRSRNGRSVRRGADCRWFSERRRICLWYALRCSKRYLSRLSVRAAIRCEIPHRRDRSASPVFSVPPDDAARGAAVCAGLRSVSSSSDSTGVPGSLLKNSRCTRFEIRSNARHSSGRGESLTLHQLGTTFRRGAVDVPRRNPPSGFWLSFGRNQRA